MENSKKRKERKEALMRILVMIVSGIILGVWRVFIYLIIFVHIVYVLVTGKRMKDMAILGETWNTQWYVFQKYIIFLDNKRPFPFGRLEKNIDRFKR